MGLEQLDDVQLNSQSGRAYPDHPEDETHYEWFDEFQDRFPEEIECDFIEVSTGIEKYNAKSYKEHEDSHRERDQYIRIAEHFLDSPTWRRRQTLLHEMVHLYCYQNDHIDVSDGSHIFKWLCGQVGCVINQVNTNSERWEDLAEPFIDEDMKDLSEDILED